MTLRATCPQCGADLKAPNELAGSDIRCPTCESRFTLPPAERKQQPKSTFVAAPKERKKKRHAPVDSPPSNPLPPVAWNRILATPYDVEFVLTETFVLTMWGFIWTFLLLAILTCILLLTMSMFAVFTVSAALAGMLRIWMISRDLSILDFLKIVTAMAAVSAVGAFLLTYLPLGEWERPPTAILCMELFFGLAGLMLVLRIVSFFFGRYFAICRRAAMQTMFSDPDQGGVVDLGYALAVLAISFGPLVLIAVVAGIVYESQAVPLQAAKSLFIALGAMALLWSYFYLPMGVAVVALQRSIAPVKVLAWALRILPDYLLFLSLVLPFHVAVWALSAAVGYLMPVPAEFTVIFGLLAALLTILVLDQYTMVVTCTALGLVLRRNEADLGWRQDAERLF